MSDQERIQECLRKEIRSLLISIKDGVSLLQLEREYLSMVGNPLPLQLLGYRSTMELVLDMPDVIHISHCGNGSIILKAIPDEATKGIANLVAKQRSSSKMKNGMHKGRSQFSFGPRSKAPPRGRVPPVLPAVVRSELKDLLTFSPVLLSDFEKAFAKRFGRSFQYMQYGFLSLFEMLNAASDIITIQQTRAGSLLTLKKNLSVEHPKKLSVGKAVVQEVGKKQPLIPLSKEKAHTSPTEPPKQILHRGETSELCQVENSYPEKLNQLENKFKSMIVQTGPGRTVSSELKEKIRFIVAKFPEGLPISKLPGEFEEIFKENLSPKELGFLSVVELVGALSDVLHVEFKEGEQDFLVFDAEKKWVTSGKQRLAVKEKKVEDKALISSPPRNSLFTADNGDTAWNWHTESQEPCNKFKAIVEPVPQIRGTQPAVLQDVLHRAQDSEAQITQGGNDEPLRSRDSLPSLEISAPEIPPDAVLDKKLCRLPLLDSSTLVGVFVEYIISPSQFYIRIYSRDSSELLEDMMIEMRRCYSNSLVSDRYVMPESMIQPGHLCCVRISEDMWWYRVIIHRVRKQEVEVFYPDFGNLGTVQKSSLRFLKCCYTKLPAQAIPCSLAWVRPIMGRWTSGAVMQFQKLCGLKPLVGVVDEYVDGVLNLFLCDTSSDEDIYFHLVLRAEGHAIVCRENIPSKGFKELNPLALYTKAISKSEEAGLTELCFSAQHYLSEDRRITNPQLEKNDVKTTNDQQTDIYVEPRANTQLLDSDLNSWKPQEKDPKKPNPEPTKPEQKIQKKAQSSLEMPYLESVSVGEDIWDENWLITQTGTEGQCHSAAENTWDEGWQSSDLKNIPRITGQKLEFQKQSGQERTPDTTKDPKPSDLGDSSDASVLSKSLEEFYISLVRSQQSNEMSQHEPKHFQTPPKQISLPTAPFTCNLLSAIPDSQEKLNGSLKNEDSSGTPPLPLIENCIHPHHQATDHISLLSPEHQRSQKLYVPQGTATAALGAAARLATSSSFLQWHPSLRRMEA
ncbi:tudor domain-containing protein 5 isoform X1 [Ornithorhynchus anatinus]|nr:tudor domain-containing protein 5 isoform X1 [Ornithorhynchus anatinus]XP_028936902.1 tudor domain-containing protein 5 isoform X1 [Ornithorhynchus anatinus]XP_039770257.1 tudor domain-containing protein 5 isoform X1 [Ornithorhynchus anatinus]